MDLGRTMYVENFVNIPSGWALKNKKLKSWELTLCKTLQLKWHHKQNFDPWFRSWTCKNDPETVVHAMQKNVALLDVIFQRVRIMFLQYLSCNFLTKCEKASNFYLLFLKAYKVRKFTKMSKVSFTDCAIDASTQSILKYSRNQRLRLVDAKDATVFPSVEF